MIFLAVATTPGRSLSWAALALFRSTGAPEALDGLDALGFAAADLLEDDFAGAGAAADATPAVTKGVIFLIVAADTPVEQLKTKYQSVLNFIQSQGVQLLNLNMEGDKLLIRASAPSADLKNRVWDQIKLVDPTASELIADIQAPAAAAAAAAGAAGAPSSAARTYTVQPGDSLSKISRQFYGDPNKYMKIFEANKDKLSDPDKVKVGTELLIP